MNDLSVRIVELQPMLVASGLGFGPSPEPLAWKKVIDFMKSQGWLDDMKSHRFFGFNNPNPSPGSPNYGYEQWVTVDKGTTAPGDIEIKEFAGGMYAVTQCEGIPLISETWGKLVAWQEDSQYKKPPNYYECLEEVVNPEVFITPDGKFIETEEAMNSVIFDLYLPVME